MSQETNTTPFEAIRQTDDAGNEFWSARDLAKVLGYKTNFRNFQPVIDKAMAAIVNSGQKPADHIAQVRNIVSLGSGAKRQVDDYRLSRYACYLIVQNSDPNKPIMALGQTYFAEQTRRQELADQWAALTEDQKRLALRGQMSVHNMKPFEAAKEAGVLEPKDFAIFNDAGYQGLYSGEKAQDIHKRKGLDEKQDILDFMDSEELGANIFRATQAVLKSGANK